MQKCIFLGQKYIGKFSLVFTFLRLKGEIQLVLIENKKKYWEPQKTVSISSKRKRLLAALFQLAGILKVQESRSTVSPGTSVTTYYGLLRNSVSAFQTHFTETTLGYSTPLKAPSYQPRPGTGLKLHPATYKLSGFTLTQTKPCDRSLPCNGINKNLSRRAYEHYSLYYGNQQVSHWL